MGRARTGRYGRAMGSPSADAACVPNIGRRERHKRLVFGVVSLGVAAVATTALIAFDASRAWRLVLLFPFWAGTIGIFQATGHT